LSSEFYYLNTEIGPFISHWT